MAPQITVYGHGSVRARSVRATLAYEGLDFELKQFKEAGEFPELFPLKKAPAIVDGDFKLSETVAVLTYLASKNRSATASGSLLTAAKNIIGAGKPSLLGHTLKDEASVLRWVSFANQEYLAATSGWFAPLNGLVGYNKTAVSEGKDKCRKLLKILDDTLKTRTFLVGEHITLADIMIADVTQSGCSFVFDKPLRQEFPDLFRHYDTIAHQDFYLACTPEGQGPVYRDEALKFTPPKKA